LLVLDEPTANLDVVSALNILRLLDDIRRKTGVTIVLVEHRLEAVATVADRFIVMDGGRIVLDGAPRDVLSDRSIESIGVGVPKVIKLYHELRGAGLSLGDIPLSPRDVKSLLLGGVLK